MNMTKNVTIIFAVSVISMVVLTTYNATNKKPDLPIDNVAPTAPAPSALAPASLGSKMEGLVMGHVSIGPNCPVEREGQPCPPSPEAYSSRAVVVYKSDGTTVKQKAPIDAAGNYKILLLPGTYFLQIDPAGIGPGEKKKVTIAPLSNTVVNFDIDTGIR